MADVEKLVAEYAQTVREMDLLAAQERGYQQGFAEGRARRWREFTEGKTLGADVLKIVRATALPVDLAEQIRDAGSLGPLGRGRLRDALWGYCKRGVVVVRMLELYGEHLAPLLKRQLAGTDSRPMDEGQYSRALVPARGILGRRMRGRRKRS